MFGCDRCQDVCPWNQRAAVPGLPAFQPRAHLHQPDLAWLLTLAPADFQHILRDSPIQRATWAGFLRNTVIAAHNSGDPALQVLADARASAHLA